MNRAMHRTLLRPSPADRRWLIFAVFGAPVMWALNQTVGLTVVGHGCHRLGKAGLTGVAVISGIAMVVALAGLFSGYRVFRRYSGGERLFSAEGYQSVQFIALFGTFVSGLLLLNLIYFGLMPFLVNPCLRLL